MCDKFSALAPFNVHGFVIKCLYCLLRFVSIQLLIDSNFFATMFRQISVNKVSLVNIIRLSTYEALWFFFIDINSEFFFVLWILDLFKLSIIKSTNHRIWSGFLFIHSIFLSSWISLLLTCLLFSLWEHLSWSFYISRCSNITILLDKLIARFKFLLSLGHFWVLIWKCLLCLKTIFRECFFIELKDVHHASFDWRYLLIGLCN